MFINGVGNEQRRAMSRAHTHLRVDGKRRVQLNVDGAFGQHNAQLVLVDRHWRLPVGKERDLRTGARDNQTSAAARPRRH